jgi:hypothetical protein
VALFTFEVVGAVGLSTGVDVPAAATDHGPIVAVYTWPFTLPPPSTNAVLSWHATVQLHA